MQIYELVIIFKTKKMVKFNFDYDKISLQRLAKSGIQISRDANGLEM
jgi:hypothetical protein